MGPVGQNMDGQTCLSSSTPELSAGQNMAGQTCRSSSTRRDPEITPISTNALEVLRGLSPPPSSQTKRTVSKEKKKKRRNGDVEGQIIRPSPPSLRPLLRFAPTPRRPPIPSPPPLPPPLPRRPGAP